MEYLGRRIEILFFGMGPNILLTFLIFCYLPAQQGLIMGVEYPHAIFDAVKEVLGLAGILDVLILHQHGLFVLDVYNFTNIAEVQHDIVDAADGVVGGDGPHEQHLRGTVLEEVLLQEGVHWDYRLGLGPDRRRHHLPVILALERQLSELGVDIAPVVPAFLALPDFGGRVGVLLDAKLDEIRRGFEAYIGGDALFGGFLGLEVRHDRFGPVFLEDGVGPVGMAAYPHRLLLLHLPRRALLELAVVDSAQVRVLEADLPEGRGEDIHFTPIGKDRPIVQLLAGDVGGFGALHLDEGLPDLGLFEDEDPLHLPVLREQLAEQVVRDDVPRLVVDAHQQNRSAAPTLLLLHTAIISIEMLGKSEIVQSTTLKLSLSQYLQSLRRLIPVPGEHAHRLPARPRHVLALAQVHLQVVETHNRVLLRVFLFHWVRVVFLGGQGTPGILIPITEVGQGQPPTIRSHCAEQQPTYLRMAYYMVLCIFVLAFQTSSSSQVASWIINVELAAYSMKPRVGLQSPEQLIFTPLTCSIMIPQDCGQWITCTGLNF